MNKMDSDRRENFPEMKRFSSCNLKNMQYFAQLCPDLRIGQHSADQLPWFHLITLLGIDKPIGVAEYQLVHAGPVPLDTALPSIEEIEAELSRDLDPKPKKRT